MKKTTFLLALLVLAISSQSQRISDLTIQGITASAPFAAFNPTNNSETVLGDGQMIVTNDVDLSNVNVSLNVGTTAFVEAPNPLPTDWSSTVSGIKVSLNDLSSWAKYNITIKKIKPAPLPLEIKTGTGNFDPTSWTPQTVGWAGVCIEKNFTLIRLNSVKRSFMVAFNSAPDSLIYTIKYLTTSFPADGTVIFDVDGSADGVNWTSINQYNGTNPMPLSSPAVVARLKIAPEYRYVRWVYTKRATTNVNIENILVTKDTTTSVATGIAPTVKLYPLGNQALRLEGAEEVASVQLYSVAGVLLLEARNPSTDIQLDNLLSGVVIGKITLKNGAVVSSKIIR
jgi:hypothetical protein